MLILSVVCVAKWPATAGADQIVRSPWSPRFAGILRSTKPRRVRVALSR